MNFMVLSDVKSNPWGLTVNCSVRIGQEMLMDEDFADDEIETELAPISVQLAYVRQVNGNLYLYSFFSLFQGH